MTKIIDFVLLSVALLASLYMTIISLGGFMVFGASSLLEVGLFVVPILTFPIVLIAVWKAGLSALLYWGLLLYFVVTHALVTWPRVSEVVRGPVHFVPMFIPAFILPMVALVRTRRQPVR